MTESHLLNLGSKLLLLPECNHYDEGYSTTQAIGSTAKLKTITHVQPFVWLWLFRRAAVQFASANC